MRQAGEGEGEVQVVTLRVLGTISIEARDVYGELLVVTKLSMGTYRSRVAQYTTGIGPLIAIDQVRGRPVPWEMHPVKLTRLESKHVCPVHRVVCFFQSV